VADAAVAGEAARTLRGAWLDPAPARPAPAPSAPAAADAGGRLSSLSFFCPAYHDEENLPALIPRVHAFLGRVAEVFEIIIVEDGSPDGTGEVADALARQYPEVRVIHHARNQGYGATLKEGFLAARHDYVMYTDGDNQYDVEEFEPFLPALAHADVLCGYAVRKAVNLQRRAQSLVYNLLVGALFFSYFRDVNCSMKVLSRRAVQAIDLVSNSAFTDAEIVLRARRAGLRIQRFPVTHYQRTKGVGSGSRPAVIAATVRDLLLFRLGRL
jgi:glycosyltransferase involved in cell wall biosynthesis